MTGILGLIVLMVDIIAIVDALKSSLDTGKKALWIILIILLPVIGMVLYFFARQEAIVYENQFSLPRDPFARIKRHPFGSSKRQRGGRTKGRLVTPGEGAGRCW